MMISEIGEGDVLMRRVMWRIMPLVTGMMILSVIDRSNIGYAKLQLAGSLQLSETAFGLASSLFFIGYSLFEIPSALATHRWGARAWFTRILITWGLLTVALAFVAGGTSLAVLRFLVGVAEAGAYPGIIFYLTLWFPRRYRVQAVALLTIGSPLGNMIGSVLGGALLDLNGTLGLAGWQWVFLVTGAPAILLAWLILRYLPNRPEETNFLNGGEKAWISGNLGSPSETAAEHESPLRVLMDIRVWFFAFAYSMITLALYGIIYWLPTAIKEFGASSSQNGMLSALPWTIAVVALIWLPKYLRERHVVLVAMAAIALCGAAAFSLATLVDDNRLRYLGLACGAPCVSLLFPCFWYLPSQMFRSARAAAAISAISTIGNLGGFAAQNLMPWVAHWSGSTMASMMVPASSLAVVALTACLLLSGWRRTPPERSMHPADADRTVAVP